MKRHLMIVVVAVAGACGGGSNSAATAPRPPEPATTAPTPAPAAEPYALAVVYEGWELWIGNDKDTGLPPDDPTRTPGMLEHVIAGFTEADLPHTAPPDALATLITYSDRPDIRMPMSPAGGLTPDRFGTQRDYFQHIGVALIAAVGVAADELAKVDRPKKYLLVISDATDTNMDEAPNAAAALAERLAGDHVQVFSLVIKARDSLPGDALAPLRPGVELSTGDALEHELAAVLRRL